MNHLAETGLSVFSASAEWLKTAEPQNARKVGGGIMMMVWSGYCGYITLFHF